MKKHKYTYALIFAVAVVMLTFMAFSGDSTKTENTKIKESKKSLIDQKLEEKLERFKTTILKKCKKETIEKAELFVDSLVAEEFRMLSNDTISFPSKPLRPSLPKKIILNDTTSIDPILSGK